MNLMGDGVVNVDMCVYSAEEEEEEAAAVLADMALMMIWSTSCPRAMSRSSL